MLIDIKEVPIKAHNSIRQLKRYYKLVKRAFKIIKNKTKEEFNNENIL